MQTTKIIDVMVVFVAMAVANCFQSFRVALEQVHDAARRAHGSEWRVALLILLLCRSSWVSADEFPKVYNSEPDESQQPLSPDEAVDGFGLPLGIKANLFAAEPEVQNPIAMAWDSRGNLWIAENYTYAERSMRFDWNLRDRVILLTDSNGDGMHDHRNVFTDQVQMLTGIEVGHGGVWLMCPPLLLKIPDADNNGVPDGPAQVVLEGFDVASDNYHNFANGLRWGPDGWLYGRCGGSCPGRVGIPGSPEHQRIPLEGGIWRYHVRHQRFEVLCHGTTNPWGHDWNEWGECFFINTVNGHLWHMIAGAHFDRPFTLDPNPYVYELLDMHADHWHFDTKGEWFQSRAGAADPFGGGHAHVGMMIYLGNQWPKEYHGRLFTWNIHGQRANQEHLERAGSGYIARHRQDILQASDPFFRGMELSYGPDGNVYAIDWSDTGECHEHTGVHRTSGRVFRFSALSDKEEPTASSRSYSIPDDSRNRSAINIPDSSCVDLRLLSSRELVDLHQHPNEWYIRQSRLILAERSLWENNHSEARSEADAAEWNKCLDRLLEFFEGSDDRLAYNAMMTLHSIGKLPDTLLDRALQHPCEHLRVWAVRLILDQHPIDSVLSQCHERLPVAQERLDQLISLSKTDSSGLVRLALASALQRLPLESRVHLARGLMSHREDASDHNLPLLVWYGLIPVAESHPIPLAEVALESTWPKTQQLIVRRLASLIEKNPEAVERVLDGCLTAAREDQVNILQGISKGLAGRRSVRQPRVWPRLTLNLLAESAAEDIKIELTAVVRELSILFSDGQTLEIVRDLVLDKTADISTRRSALEALVASRSEGIVDVCLPLLDDARLNGIAIRGLAESFEPDVARALVKNYYRFRSPQRPAVIALLTSRVSSTEVLLSSVESGKISKEDITAYDVRQMNSLGNERVTQQLASIWGMARRTAEDKRQRIDEVKTLVSETERHPADLVNGRQLFDRLCGICHRLFGSGQAIGPDLTGANRRDLDFLLENIIDPSAILSSNYHASIIRVSDGRVLTGLVVAQNEQTLEMQTQTERLTLSMSEIEDIRKAEFSPMPDGLLDNLNHQQVIDLIAYLQHPTQVALP